MILHVILLTKLVQMHLTAKRPHLNTIWRIENKTKLSDTHTADRSYIE